uniref:Uncharacterized protein n=1 Tax=Amphimedon queenslandica TaxID=400682 RepID=A0A1X7VFH4_AMPQE
MADRNSVKRATVALGSGEKGPEELSFISEGLPPIPSKVVQKIEKGEYVKFVDILLRKSGWEEPSISEFVQEEIIVVIQSKHLNCQKKRSRMWLFQLRHSPHLPQSGIGNIPPILVIS